MKFLRPLALLCVFLGGLLHAAEPVPTDLYLLIGQSNMAGRGRLTDADRQPAPRVLVLNKDDVWASQGEPIHFDKKEAGVGLGFTFGKLMAEKNPSAVIGLIPCAVGGTPISRWQPQGDLYQAALARAKIALKNGRLKGILWHQGESDSGEKTAPVYAKNLKNVADAFRRDLNAPNVPFVAGQLGEFLLTRAKPNKWAGVVNEQIDSLPSLVPNSAVVSSKGLGHKGDELHFSSEALKEFGKRYFEAMVKLQAAAKK